MRTAVIYGTSTCNAQNVAEKIGAQFDDAFVEDVANVNIVELAEYDLIILGSGTGGFGDVADDWEDKLDDLDMLDLSDASVALFGTGDQTGYPDSFVGSMSHLYEKVAGEAGKFIGFTDTEGYDFEDSESVVDGKFVGLAIDEENQSDLTDGRIESWVNQLKSEVAA